MKRSIFRSFGLLLCSSVFVGTLAGTASAEPPKPDNSGFHNNGVTAHRGMPEAYPENTFQGYQAAIDLGVDWIELDIFTTADGQIVVSHDTTTGRFADRNLVIAESTYAELSTLDVAYSFRQEHGLTETEVPPARMPLLSEILDMVMKQDGTRASLQPKDGSTAAAVQMIQEMGAQQWVGFNDGNLAKMSLVKELDPSIHVFWDLPAKGDLASEIATAQDRGFDSLVVNQARVSPELIATIEDAGFESGAWTVNDTAVMQQFINWGIDRLYTDSADQALLLFGEDARQGLQQGLLGHWAMNDVNGSVADEDGSPNPIRNGRLQANATLTPMGKGHLGGAVTLDGTSDYVDVPFEVVPDEAPAYTVSAWINPEQFTGARQVILESSGSSAMSIELAEGSGNLKYSVQTTGQSVVAESNIAPAADEWHHVAVTYDANGSTQLFLNGGQVTTFVDGPALATGSLTDTDGLHVGANQSADGHFFHGAIDDVAVWNRVLSGAELGEVWNDGAGTAVTGSYDEPAGTPGWWKPKKK